MVRTSTRLLVTRHLYPQFKVLPKNTKGSKKEMKRALYIMIAFRHAPVSSYILHINNRLFIEHRLPPFYMHFANSATQRRRDLLRTISKNLSRSERHFWIGWSIKLCHAKCMQLKVVMSVMPHSAGIRTKQEQFAPRSLRSIFGSS